MLDIARAWRNSMAHGQVRDNEKRSGARHEADLLALLVKSLVVPQSGDRRTRLADDLVAVRRIVGSLLEAVDDGTIAEYECAAVLRMVTANFTTRRLDTILERIYKAPESRWQVTARHRRSHG